MLHRPKDIQRIEHGINPYDRTMDWVLRYWQTQNVRAMNALSRMTKAIIIGGEHTCPCSVRYWLLIGPHGEWMRVKGTIHQSSC